MGKKFNELAELRDRNRQLMDENRRLRLALKVSARRSSWHGRMQSSGTR